MKEVGFKAQPVSVLCSRLRFIYMAIFAYLSSALLCWRKALCNGLSVCLCRLRILNVTRQGSARDAASIHFCPSITMTDRLVTFASGVVQSLTTSIVTTTHLCLVALLEFRRDLWQQKTRIPGLSYGVVCLILHSRFGTTSACYRRTNGQMDRQTDGRTHDDSIYRACIARRAVKFAGK